MRKESGVLLVLILVLAIGSIAMADDAPWFDPENCQMCKPIMEIEGLLENMTRESYQIANGMIKVINVTEGYEDKFHRSYEEMMASWQKMISGEEMQLCGQCQAFVDAWDETVRMETIKTKTGEISLITSTNPETVAKLHEIVKRSAEEMAALMASKEKLEHASHDH